MKRTAAVSEEANRRRESWQVYGCQEAEVASDLAFFCTRDPGSVT